MSEKIVQLNEEVIKGQIKELVRGSVEETLNELLEKEAESLTQAARYERSKARQGYRSGHYDRNLTTASGDVTLHVPRLKGVSFETAIIERYRRRESSVEEALILSLIHILRLNRIALSKKSDSAEHPSQTAYVLQDILERGNVVVIPQGVDTVIHGDIADTASWEKVLNQMPGLQIVTPQSAEVFRDDKVDLPALNGSQHSCLLYTSM